MRSSYSSSEFLAPGHDWDEALWLSGLNSLSSLDSQPGLPKKRTILNSDAKYPRVADAFVPDLSGIETSLDSRAKSVLQSILTVMQVAPESIHPPNPA